MQIQNTSQSAIDMLNDIGKVLLSQKNIYTFRSMEQGGFIRQVGLHQKKYALQELILHILLDIMETRLFLNKVIRYLHLVVWDYGELMGSSGIIVPFKINGIF